MKAPPFQSALRKILTATPIPDRLRCRPAVVLERLARAAGNVEWYYCFNQDDLAVVEDQLRPGSLVSFYFDDRIEYQAYSAETLFTMKRILEETGEAVVGSLLPERCRIDMEVIVGPQELEQLSSQLSSSGKVFYGVFPARDNDGIRAVTFTVPDRDGIVRSHPH